jgi:hypothetical protein
VLTAATVPAGVQQLAVHGRRSHVASEIKPIPAAHRIGGVVVDARVRAANLRAGAMARGERLIPRA